MVLFTRIIVAIVCYLVIYGSLYSQDNNKDQMNSRGDSLVIKIATIGPGDDLTSWWGHTAVIVEDKTFNVSRFYNYGLFSFDQENFISK